MILSVKKSELFGTLTPPPSKSHSVRALILAALSEKGGVIKNLLKSGDIFSAISCLEKMGVKIFRSAGNKPEPVLSAVYALQNRQYAPFGQSAKFSENMQECGEIFQVIPPEGGIFSYLSSLKEPLILDVGNSGTLLYFLPMIAAAIPAHFIFTGDDSILHRPLKPLTEILDCLGVEYKIPKKNNSSAAEAKSAKPALPVERVGQTANTEQPEPFPPASSVVIEIFGKKMCGKKTVNADGGFSQPVSGLLTAAPVFYEDTEIILNKAGELPYIKMTLKRLADCGVRVEVSEDFKTYFVRGKQKIYAPYTAIPSDWSSAAFLLLAACASNSPLKIAEADITDTQGDSAIISFLKKMNAPIFYDEEKKELEIKAHNNCLKGAELDLSGTPDLLPAMAAAALFAEGKTVLKNIEICRSKECDRIKAAAEELGKLGGILKEGKDFLEIIGTGGRGLKPAVTDSRNDHRIALMLAAASCGIAPTLTEKPHCVQVKNFECVSVSYPQFTASMKTAGADFSVSN